MCKVAAHYQQIDEDWHIMLDEHDEHIELFKYSSWNPETITFDEKIVFSPRSVSNLAHFFENSYKKHGVLNYADVDEIEKLLLRIEKLNGERYFSLCEKCFFVAGIEYEPNRLDFEDDSCCDVCRRSAKRVYCIEKGGLEKYRSKLRTVQEIADHFEDF